MGWFSFVRISPNQEIYWRNARIFQELSLQQSSPTTYKACISEILCMHFRTSLLNQYQ